MAENEIVTKDLEVHGGVQWTMVSGTSKEGGSDIIVRQHNLKGGAVVTPEQAIAQDGQGMTEVAENSNVGFRMITQQFTVRAKSGSGDKKETGAPESRVLYRKKMRSEQENDPANIDKSSTETK